MRKGCQGIINRKGTLGRGWMNIFDYIEKNFLSVPVSTSVILQLSLYILPQRSLPGCSNLNHVSSPIVSSHRILFFVSKVVITINNYIYIYFIKNIFIINVFYVCLCSWCIPRHLPSVDSKFHE